MRRTTVNGVLNKYFPPIACLLQSVEVKGHEVIEEVAFDLSTEDIELASQDIQGVTIAPWGTGPGG